MRCRRWSTLGERVLAGDDRMLDLDPQPAVAPHRDEACVEADVVNFRAVTQVWRLCSQALGDKPTDCTKARENDAALA